MHVCTRISTSSSSSSSRPRPHTTPPSDMTTGFPSLYQRRRRREFACLRRCVLRPRVGGLGPVPRCPPPLLSLLLSRPRPSHASSLLPFSAAALRLPACCCTCAWADRAPATAAVTATAAVAWVVRVAAWVGRERAGQGMGRGRAACRCGGCYYSPQAAYRLLPRLQPAVAAWWDGVVAA